MRPKFVTRYGNVKAVFDPSPWEKSLRDSVASFSVQTPCMDPSGVVRAYTAILDGVTGNWDSKPTSRTMAAVRLAYPFPKTIAEGIAEIQVWDQLRRDRSAFVKYEHEHDMEVEARIKALEDFLNHHPAETWDDIDARFDWDLYSWGRQWIEPEKHVREDDFSPRIRADIAIMRAKVEAGDIGQSTDERGVVRISDAWNFPGNFPKRMRSENEAAPTYRTNADRKAAVLAALREYPGHSDRQIAALAGVSHQTVNNWRRRLAEAGSAHG